jgi:uncharacterized repeat protein (TIGR01451 family)
MTKTATQNRVTVGDTVTYKLVAKNDGPDAAPDVKVRDTVPHELDVREATTTQGDCNIDGNQVNCTLGTLPARRSATVTVRAVAVRAGTATNVAVVDVPPQPNPQVEDPRTRRATTPTRRPYGSSSQSCELRRRRPSGACAPAGSSPTRSA